MKNGGASGNSFKFGFALKRRTFGPDLKLEIRRKI